jgi:hypothetical protein
MIRTLIRKGTSFVTLMPFLFLWTLVVPLSHAEVTDVSGVLHVLPPLGQSTKTKKAFDPTLTEFLKVRVCETTAGGGCTAIEIEFTSQGGKGMPSIRLQDSRYHVNWHVADNDKGKEFEIHFLVAGLEVGYVRYVASARGKVPIKFGIDNHPLIRATVLKAKGRTAMEVAGVLRDEFGLTADETAAILSEVQYGLKEIVETLVAVFGADAQECADLLKAAGESAVAVGRALKDVFALDAQTTAGMLKEAGYDAAKVFDMLTEVYGKTLAEATAILAAIGFTSDEVFGATASLLVAQFAPQLRFDSGGSYNAGPDTFPMSAQDFYDQIIETEKYKSPHEIVSNDDPTTITNKLLPTYWRAFQYGNQVRIVYWWFYGYQDTCDGWSGSHNGDWERVMVILSEDTTQVAAVVFWQHKAQYTRLPQRGGVSFYGGTHPVVQVGRTTHGSFHNTQTDFQTCCYWEDHRDGNGPQMNTWENLVRLEPASEGGEEWMSAEITKWGYDGISTNPMAFDKNSFQALRTCGGWTTWQCDTSGCFRSQCEVGDRDDGFATCWHCAAGYIDWGAFCVKDCSWYPFCSSHSISTYGFEYTISLTDKGLLYKSPDW